MASRPDPALQDTLSVGQLNELIRYALSVTFPYDVWVEGEISSLKRHSSGHVYFHLVEATPGRDADVPDGARSGSRPSGSRADATLAVVLYERDKHAVNAMLRRAGGAVRMVDGVHIRVRGSIDYYPAQGKLQLRMRAIDPEFTLGALVTERERVLAALRAERLLDRNSTLPFPTVPSRVGLVTAPESAAEADFLDELRRSGLAWHVTYIPTAVQGSGADTAIARAVTHLAGTGVDVIALVRGGGAKTDLLTFDSESIARAIALAPVPVVTGIGHEIDASIADATAAIAYKTPTACAAGLVERARLAHEHADDAFAAIERRARHIVDRSDRAVADAAHRVAAGSASRVHLAARSLGERTDRLARAGRHQLVTASRVLDGHALRTRTLDPQRLLARGWSITRTAHGTVLRDTHDARVGAPLVTRVAGGEVTSTVTSTTPIATDASTPEVPAP